MAARLAVLAAGPAVVPPPAVQERGMAVNLSSSFYRPQSCFSRDLAVLSAVVQRRQRQQQQLSQEVSGSSSDGAAPTRSPAPSLHVLDLMAGSGIRSMRYLLQAGADHVLCNEGDPANMACLESNLSAAVAAVAVDSGITLAPTAAGGREWRIRADVSSTEEPPLCELRHEEAGSLLARCRLEGRFFDLIDSDSFGAASHIVGAALGAARFGGLVCLTSTSGTIAGGRDPASALALFGQHLAPVPSANEQGLRSLIGLAHREALAQRLTIRPLWSLYSPHGPVFRALLQVERQQHQSHQQQQHYGYSLHWSTSGESACVSWHDLPAALYSAGLGASGGSAEQPLLSGPMWLGPLHSTAHLRQVQQEAAARGWLEAETQQPATRKGSVRSLGQLLELMLGEAEAEEVAAAAGTAGASGAATLAAASVAEKQGLEQGQQQQQQQQQCIPPWFIRISDVGRVGALVGPPSRDKLAAELRRRGHLAVQSHVDSGALKTTATMAEAVAAATEGLGIRSRLKDP